MKHQEIVGTKSDQPETVRLPLDQAEITHIKKHIAEWRLRMGVLFILLFAMLGFYKIIESVSMSTFFITTILFAGVVYWLYWGFVRPMIDDLNEGYKMRRPAKFLGRSAVNGGQPSVECYAFGLEGGKEEIISFDSKRQKEFISKILERESLRIGDDIILTQTSSDIVLDIVKVKA